MYCPKCGTQLPDDAAFCMKCGYSLSQRPGSSSQSFSGPQTQQQPAKPVIAPQGATAMKCPSCGAPITPKFGEMVITCEYCGSGVTLGNSGWTSISKQTMLPMTISSRDDILAKIHDLMDHGLLHRHVQESSSLEEATISIVPYWIISASARTSITSVSEAAEVGQVATTAALIGILGGMAGGGGGHGRRAIGPGFGGGLGEGLLVGSMMGGGFGGGMGGGNLVHHELDENYNYPIVALKALTQYQPKDYRFAMDQRALFDVSKISKSIKILNGDVSEEAAKYQAKTLVSQLQSQKAHDQYHMIQSIDTQVDVADTELLYVPTWFVRYDHKGNKIILVMDANSGQAINSFGL